MLRLAPALLVPILVTIGCDRLDRGTPEAEGITVEQLATHLGVSRYVVEIPAGVARPTIVLREERRDGDVGGMSRIGVNGAVEAVLLLRFDASEGGRATVFSSDGPIVSMHIGAPFPNAGRISAVSDGGPRIKSGHALILCGTDGDSESTRANPEWTLRLYVLEEGQTPENAGW